MDFSEERIYQKNHECHIVWKLLKCRILNFNISHHFCPFRTNLSGNTIWPQFLGTQKLAMLNETFLFSNTMNHAYINNQALLNE